MALRSRLLLFGLAVLAAGLVAALPRPAQAHAVLVSSTPLPGSRLAGAPARVVLTFSEPVNRGLTTGSVVGPDGRTFLATSVDERTITVDLPSNTAGTYVVSWTSVSALDGHVLNGEFRFSVGPPATALGGQASTRPVAEAAIALLRALEDLALLLAVGLLLIGFLAAREPAFPWALPGRRLTLALALALGTGVLGVGAETLSATSSLAPAALAAYLGGGLSGWARVGRLGAEAVALLLSLSGWRRVAPALLLALLGVAAAGHATTVDPAGVGVATDLAHLVSTGCWAGAIVALATARPPGGWRRGEGRDILRRFSPIALVAFAGTGVTGFLRGDQELRGLADLVATPYGQLLSLKVLAVGVMVALSFLAWRWGRASPRLEAAVALAVVAETALLTTLPLPAASVAPAGGGDRSAQALPRAGDVSLATNAGKVLVGLTVRPALSDRDGLWLYLLPFEGPGSASRLPVTLAVGGSAVPLRRCGSACRTATIAPQPGAPVQVAVGGSEGGIAQLTMPPPASADAGALVGRSLQRMDQLHTFRTDETIRPATPPFMANFAFQAPDALTLDLSDGAQTVIVGSARYVRDKPEGPWRREAAVPVKVPSFPWDASPPEAAQVIGTDTADGVPSRIVAFFEGNPTFPTWFQLWVGPDNLVRRAQMETLGHFMTDHYYAFDTPLTITPPS